MLRSSSLSTTVLFGVSVLGDGGVVSCGGVCVTGGLFVTCSTGGGVGLDHEFVMFHCMALLIFMVRLKRMAQLVI